VVDATQKPGDSYGSLGAAFNAFAVRSARPAQVLGLLGWSAGLAVVIFLISAWACANGRAAPPPYYGPPIAWDEIALADILSLILLGLGLFVVAPAAVTAQLSAERRNGTLDQLRTTPLSPLGLLVGFAVGVPLRIYLLCAGPLALHVLAVVTGRIPVEVFLATTMVLVTGTAFCVVFGATLALAPQRDGAGALLAVLTAGFLGIGAFVGVGMSSSPPSAYWAYLHPAGALSSAMLSHHGMWQQLLLSPWRVESFVSNSTASQALALSATLSVGFSLILVVLIGAAACRRLGAGGNSGPGDRPLFGKLHGLSVFSVVAAGIVLPAMSGTGGGYYYSVGATFALAAALLPVLVLVALQMTPTQEAWSLHVRSGRGGFFSDAAAPHVAVWAMLLVFAVLAYVAVWQHGGYGGSRGLAALSWAGLQAALLPVLLLFGATRFATPGARGAYFASLAAHVIVQMVTIGLLVDHRHDGPQQLFLRGGFVEGLAIPLFVAYRQYALRRSVLAARRHHRLGALAG